VETRPFRGIEGVRFLRVERLVFIRRLMLGLWLLYYLTWATWSKEAFANFVTGLGRNIIWKVFFVSFLFFLAAEIIYKFRQWYKRARVLAFVRVILPAGIFIFLTGFFLSANMRMETRILTGKDDVFTIPWSEKRFAVMNVRPGIKERFLDIEQDAPSAIFTREPLLLITDFERTYRIGTFPPARIDGTFFHILNSNIAPSIELRNQKGEIIEKGDLALQILPAGNTDFAHLINLPYRITMKLLPSGEIKRGEVLAKEYNLEDRLYEIKVYRIKNPEEAGVLIAQGNSRRPLSFDGYTLTVTGHTYWVLLEIVKDDAVYIIGAGIVLIIFGIILRLLLLPISIHCYPKQIGRDF
jgi:hypothetical protein